MPPLAQRPWLPVADLYLLAQDAVDEATRDCDRGLDCERCSDLRARLDAARGTPARMARIEEAILARLARARERARTLGGTDTGERWVGERRALRHVLRLWAAP